jgi:hypothetical protein
MGMTAEVPPEKRGEVRVEGVPGGPPPVPPAPLDETHFLMIRRAVFRRKIVRSAARAAAWDAGITLAIGLLGLMLSLAWWSWLGILVTVGICAIGCVGLVARRLMSDAKPSAARILAVNQLAFMTLILLYCVIQMLTFSPAAARAALLSPEVVSQLRDLPGMDQALADIERSAPTMVYGFYSLVILLSVCAQGGMALYYVTRRRHVEAFRRETPEWILRLFIELGM